MRGCSDCQTFRVGGNCQTSSGKIRASAAEISAFVPHQANLRIIEAIAKRLGIPRERVADDIIHSGNTSSASIPLALSRMAEQGRLQPGTPALMIAFGAGLSYAAQVVTVP